MPWKVTDVMEERIRFVKQVLRGQESMSKLCRQFGISRSTGYVWWNRYRGERTVGALQDRCRRPHCSPRQTPEVVEKRVVQLRHRYGWGGKKLLVLLQQEGLYLSLPTVNRIIRRQGLVRAKASHRPAVKRFERQAPNELWQMDFKGPYRGPGKPCIPLSILDDHSRYAVGLYALQDLDTEGVLASVRRSFQHYGLPQAVLMDHGVPWWSNTNGHGLTRFAVHLIEQGIHLIYGSVAHPQTQGKVERFHRTLAEAVYHRGRPRQLHQWQQFLAHFRQEYNFIRPHEALKMAVPASRYQPSPRAYNPRPQPWDYPSALQTKRLSQHGCLHHAGRYYFVCEALGRRRVGIEPFDDKLLVRYRQMYIREINLQTRQTRALVCRVRT